MISAVFFDLDNCLSAGRAVPECVYRAGFDAIRAANQGHLTEEQLERAFEDAWRLAIDDVAERHGFSEAMRDAALAVFGGMEVDEPMSGYPDLHLVREIPARRFLVTTGFRRLQESKIRALGIGDWFEEIVVDAIGEPGRRGKEGIFRDLMQKHGFSPAEVLVVGDNPDSELGAGQRLGCRTVQTLRPGVRRAENIWRHVEGLGELLKILQEE